VVVTSLFGGPGPGIVDTILSTILGFLVSPPAWTLRLTEREDAIRIGLFCLLGLLISAFVGVVGELQRELNRERGTFATTLRSIADGVISTDENGRITFLNDVAERATGWSLADAIGKLIEETIPFVAPGTLAAVQNPVREALDTGAASVLSSDTLLLRRDGKRILISGSAAPIRDDLTKVAGVVLVFRDVTKSRAEADLERQRLREIMAHAPAAIGVLRGPEHRWEYLNNKYVYVTGRQTASEFIGKTLGESLPEIESQPYIHLLDEVYETGIPFVGFEMKATLNRAATGQPDEAYFDLVFQPLRDSEERVDGILIHALEVTDRVHARKHRQEAEDVRRRLATIVESSDDAIISKDLKGVITSWNSAAEAIFGYSASEMIGKSVTTIIPPELHRDEQRILETIGNGQRINHFETTRVKKSGKRLSVSLTISPLRDETGSVIGAAKIVRDITLRKMTERALHQSETLASVGRLASTMAHEINNPLEAITNLIYLARTKTAQEDVREYLRIADGELKRVAYITRQTLSLFVETKGAARVKLGDLMDTAISVASRTRNKGIVVCPEVRQDPEIWAVPSEIRQLIAHLLSNSFDAVDAKGLVRVRISAAKDWTTGNHGVRLAVADSGCGIPASVRSSLFEPFVTTKPDVGAGLGLWACKKIVDKHCGSIRVKSSTAPGRCGTVFCVFLPLHPEEMPAESCTA
jgi:PAS domain S-box-containing protein